MITQRVDGVVLAPTHDEALADVVKKCHAKGIPISIFDSGIKCDPSNYVTFAATDNYKGGVLAARRMAELLGRRARSEWSSASPAGRARWNGGRVPRHAQEGVPRDGTRR
jgi:ABC-type sugar transport system substrate-binding protein